MGHQCNVKVPIIAVPFDWLALLLAFVLVGWTRASAGFASVLGDPPPGPMHSLCHILGQRMRLGRAERYIIM